MKKLCKKLILTLISIFLLLSYTKNGFIKETLNVLIRNYKPYMQLENKHYSKSVLFKHHNFNIEIAPRIPKRIAPTQQQNNYSWISRENRLSISFRNKGYATYTQIVKETNISAEQSRISVPVLSALFPPGGLGNQMFVYASCYGIARKNKRVFQYVKHHSTNLKNIFNINQTSIEHNDRAIVDKHLYLSDPFCCVFNPVLLELPPVNIAVGGYLQSWKYFSNYKADLYEQFRFKHVDLITTPLRTIQQIKRKHPNSDVIGVHIRRGDMLYEGNRKHGHKVADQAYLVRAITYMEEKLHNTSCVYIVCSQDMEWAKGNLPMDGRAFIFSERRSAEFEMELLSLCDHVIVTVGTYGWWSAYLNRIRNSNAIVLYYKDWPRNGSELDRITSHEDYFPPEWIGL